MRHAMSTAGLTEMGRLLLMSPLLFTWAGSPGRPTSGSDGTPLRVLLLDGCSTFRQGLRQALEEAPGITVVGEGGTAAEGMALLERVQADVAVVDVDLPDRSGIELCRQLVRERPELVVLLLSQWDWDVYLAAARAALAQGFLLRQQPTAELVRAIRDSRQRKLFTSEQLERIGTWVANVGQLLITLTPRQWDVLWLVAAGMSNRDIASHMSLSENTVEKHIGAILGKLGLPSRASLLGFILQNHLEVLNPPGHWPKVAVHEWWTSPTASASTLERGPKELRVARSP